MYLFIINPVAGNGKAKRLHHQFRQKKIYRRINAVYELTEYAGHAEMIISKWLNSEYKNNIDTIVVLGGDGTMHEVINGLQNNYVTLAYIPSGSGNDFARAINLTDHSKDILNYIESTKKVKKYWLGTAHFDDIMHRKFINCAGFGFDAIVAKSANESMLKRLFNKLYLGSVIYIVMLIYKLLLYKPISITMELDNSAHEFKQCFLLVINNHPYFGGGMKINPLAHNQANDLSVLVVDAISKWKVLALFGTVFTGKHLNFKEVHTFRSKEITIESKEFVTYQIDGESGTAKNAFICRDDQHINIKV